MTKLKDCWLKPYMLSTITFVMPRNEFYIYIISPSTNNRVFADTSKALDILVRVLCCQIAQLLLISFVGSEFWAGSAIIRWEWIFIQIIWGKCLTGVGGYSQSRRKKLRQWEIYNHKPCQSGGNYNKQYRKEWEPRRQGPRTKNRPYRQWWV